MNYDSSALAAHTVTSRSHQPRNPASASSQPAFSNMRENPVGYVFFEVISLHPMQRDRERGVTLGFAILPDILSFFFLFQFKYCTLYMAVIFAHSKCYIFFSVYCQSYRCLGLLSRHHLMRLMLEAHSLTFCMLPCNY